MVGRPMQERVLGHEAVVRRAELIRHVVLIEGEVRRCHPERPDRLAGREALKGRHPDLGEEMTSGLQVLGSIQELRPARPAS